MKRIELDGFGEHRPLYVLVDEPRKHTGDCREPSRNAGLSPGDEYRVLHVISRPWGGEVRGYVLANGVAHLRYPASPAEWPEVDAAVAAAMCVTVKAVA